MACFGVPRFLFLLLDPSSIGCFTSGLMDWGFDRLEIRGSRQTLSAKPPARSTKQIGQGVQSQTDNPARNRQMKRHEWLQTALEGLVEPLCLVARFEALLCITRLCVWQCEATHGGRKERGVSLKVA